MKTKDLIGAVVFLIIAVFILLSDDLHQRVVKYDCSLSEISPDYPIAVKEACRKMRAEKVK